MKKECLPCDIIPEHEGVYGVWRQKFCAFLASELSEGKRSAHEKRGPAKTGVEVAWVPESVCI
jgi:hypothetical protein